MIENKALLSLKEISHQFCDPRVFAFPNEYAVSTVLRPDVPLVEAAIVQKLQRLTPSCYDRNIFHLELNLTGTSRLNSYKMGDALAVYPKNSKETVDDFIRVALLSESDQNSNMAIESIRQQLITLPSFLISLGSTALDVTTDSMTSRLFSKTVSSTSTDEHITCVTTVERLLTTILDISGMPTKEFFMQLSRHTIDILEKVRLVELTLERLQNEFNEVVVNAAMTYTSVLKAFRTARPSIDALIEIIPPMKPRLYSIASSSLYQPSQLDLLVVVETWKPIIATKSLNPLNENTSGKNDNVTRSGLCSQYLSTLKEGDTVMASLTSSTMFLPESQLSPIVMAGLGTGMAPFRAFLQEKLYWKRRGQRVGPLALYFGSRHKKMEFLYGDELVAFQQEGLLTRLGCAFSRDQAQKIYIQDKIREDAEFLAVLLVENKGYFYLCGPTWPAQDVKEALITAFMKYGGKGSREEAEELLKQMKEESRYVLEVY